jgi:hypothetical protein
LIAFYFYAIENCPIFLMELAMDSVPCRSKNIESAISICILALLFILAAGLIVKQADYDMGRFGISIEQARRDARRVADTSRQASQQAGKDEFSAAQLSRFLAVGFESLSGTEIYAADNLYEKINGKATLYTESGFERLYTQRFVNKDDDSLWMELFVYDMADIKNAFSVYSVQKRADVKLLPVSLFAYQTTNGLYFVQGRFYIEIVGSAESDELSDAMKEIARRFVGEVAIDKTTQIAELSLFPQENFIPGSSKLYLKSTFGFEGLNNTFVAGYNFNGQTITAFFSRRSDRQDAQQVAKDYHNFLIDSGGKARPTANETLKHLQATVVDFYGATEIVFAIGSFVAGVHEAENQPSAEQLAVMFVNELSKAGNND